MSLKGLIEDLPEHVDLIVARQQRVSPKAVASVLMTHPLNFSD